MTKNIFGTGNKYRLVSRRDLTGTDLGLYNEYCLSDCIGEVGEFDLGYVRNDFHVVQTVIPGVVIGQGFRILGLRSKNVMEYGRYWSIRSTNVKSVEQQDDSKIHVVTNNTLYVFEIIDKGIRRE